MITHRSCKQAMPLGYFELGFDLRCANNIQVLGAFLACTQLIWNMYLNFIFALLQFAALCGVHKPTNQPTVCKAGYRCMPNKRKAHVSCCKKKKKNTATFKHYKRIQQVFVYVQISQCRPFQEGQSHKSVTGGKFLNFLICF